MAIYDYEKEKRIEEVRNIALKKISYRMYTESEIVKVLKDKDCSNEEVDEAISFLKQYKYIDDSLYTYYYYKEHILKNKSKNRIVYELKRKGINDNSIEEGFSKLEKEGFLKDEFVVAMELANKMIEEQLAFNKEIDEKFNQRLIRRLLSKGFSSEISYKVLTKMNR